MTIPNPPLSSITSPHTKRVSSDYKISVPTNGTIFLDTGTNVGLVYITGNLTVQGNTTTVNTQNVTIEDNILVLNKGESGFGVTSLQSGIEIDRGVAPNGNAQFLWIEGSYVNPITGNNDYGYFTFRTAGNANLAALRTNTIDTNGQNLALVTRGTGIITVAGTTNYEEQVLDYGNNLAIRDKDIVPNMQAVVDKINYQISNNPSSQIKRNDTRVAIFDSNIADFINNFDTGSNLTTTITVNHTLATNADLNVVVGTQINIQNSGIPNLDGVWNVTNANPLDLFFVITISNPIILTNQTNESQTIYVLSQNSNVTVYVDNTQVSRFFSSYIDLFNIKFDNTTITTESGTDLILYSNGPGSVQIQDDIRLQHIGINSQNTAPNYALDSVKLYSSDEGPGATGLFYIGPSDRPGGQGYRRDELISKKKAIAFSILM